jgi:hypothetical protein
MIGWHAGLSTLQVLVFADIVDPHPSAGHRVVESVSNRYSRHRHGFCSGYQRHHRCVEKQLSGTDAIPCHWLRNDGRENRNDTKPSKRYDS